MNGFIIALQFLTVFTVKKGLAPTREELSGSMAFFPLVGGALGLILVAADFILMAALPEKVVPAILLLILVVTNAGLHIDGFADTVDGLAGGGTHEERLRIMKDPAIGAAGAAAVVLMVLLKYLCILELRSEIRTYVLFLFPMAGRWAMTPMAFNSTYARSREGIGSAFTEIKPAAFITATALFALFSVAALGVFSLALMACLWLSAYFFTGFFKKRLGGVTGDVFGFQSETAEALFLLTFLALDKAAGFKGYPL
ncbi:MAG: adenosylcobinamide-GDP ribazoletransferase [Deltaproteobacteria bacterium]|nr:adenosylcobinamide-GDP ribazoletransferase [Deltaproteobacteria bacterium]